ncbi:hypothetical protein A5785_06895 [Gordonia sp. 852002-50395_SCH5434458]|nr:hypothetical protein A5785_06895 [Gordonia sp. 852002-50395_SCH5434458]
MPGNKITIFEELGLPGGSMDGILDEHKGVIIRGGREMEAHFEALRDLFKSIPSLAIDNASVLDEMYWLHKTNPSSNPATGLTAREDEHADAAALQVAASACLNLRASA